MSLAAHVFSQTAVAASQELSQVQATLGNFEPEPAVNDVEHSLEVHTSKGTLEATYYADGTLAFWSPHLTLQLPPEEAQRLSELLQRFNAPIVRRTDHAALAPVPLAPAVPAPLEPRPSLSCVSLLAPNSAHTKKIPQHISLESQGWGVNVGAALRYYYQSRDAARLARANHPIGRFGRVA